MEQFRRMDFVGFVLFTGGLAVFIMGLSWGGTVYPWGSGHVVATIVVGFIALAVFVLYGMLTEGHLCSVLTNIMGRCILPPR